MRAVWIGMLAVSALFLVATAQASGDLAKNSGCLNCHAVENKLVGPALKDIGTKYAGIDGAAAMLAGKIQQGSNGVWGAIPMPPNTGVSEENAKVLAEWILSLK